MIHIVNGGHVTRAHSAFDPFYGSPPCRRKYSMLLGQHSLFSRNYLLSCILSLLAQVSLFQQSIQNLSSKYNKLIVHVGHHKRCWSKLFEVILLGKDSVISHGDLPRCGVSPICLWSSRSLIKLWIGPSSGLPTSPT